MLVFRESVRSYSLSIASISSWTKAEAQMRATKPILALDVDGPIVLFGEHLQDDIKELWVGEVPITISRSIGETLSRLAGRFQIVWYSSWERSASYELAPKVGLPAGLPWVDLNLAQANQGESRKFPALKAWMRASPPLAIVDDEIGLDMVKWANDRDVPTLLLEIDPRSGLGDKHVNKLFEFADEVGSYSW